VIVTTVDDYDYDYDYSYYPEDGRRRAVPRRRPSFLL